MYNAFFGFSESPFNLSPDPAFFYRSEQHEEALANLREAVALYLDEVDDPESHITGTPLVTSFQVSGAA